LAHDGYCVGVMALGGFGFFITIICAASRFGNGSVFKIIPGIKPKEAGPMIGVVSCVGALGASFPPFLLGACFDRFGSAALVYTRWLSSRLCVLL
jgi:nitrate/nitrite transporter NarK